MGTWPHSRSHPRSFKINWHKSGGNQKKIWVSKTILIKFTEKSWIASSVEEVINIGLTKLKNQWDYHAANFHRFKKNHRSATCKWNSKHHIGYSVVSQIYFQTCYILVPIYIHGNYNNNTGSRLKINQMKLCVNSRYFQICKAQ